VFTPLSRKLARSCSRYRSIGPMPSRLRRSPFQRSYGIEDDLIRELHFTHTNPNSIHSATWGAWNLPRRPPTASGPERDVRKRDLRAEW
jgi:hypothetical protein